MLQQAMLVAERHENILRDWYGRNCVRRLVAAGDQIWFVKCKDAAERKRDLLATFLASGWMNIAEARNLTADEFVKLRGLDLRLPSPISMEDTYLVRFALDYHVDALPLSDPDFALAYELVFSLWVRRRDAHSFNRVYQDGVPIFFDFGTAFLGEPQLKDLSEYFSMGPDSGWAGWWKLWPCRKSDRDTCLQRQMETENFRTTDPRVIIPVGRHTTFVEGLYQCERKIADLGSRHILDAIERAEFTGSQQQDIYTFLVSSQRELKAGIEILRTIVLAP